MYYLIETKDQLNRFFKDEGDECYLQFITNNDEVHPKLQSLCALYIYSFNKEKGFIINLNHPEAFKLDLPLNYLKSYTNIFVKEKTKALLHLPQLPYTDIQSIFYLLKNEPLDPLPKTAAHIFYERKFGANNVNKIIPLAKHYEALTQEFTALHPYIINYKSEDSNKWYNDILTPTLAKMVSEGIKINGSFQKHFEINEKFSIKDDKIYGWYNFCTTTGRPTNNFNKINFSALKHDSGERDAFEANNDVLVEMDYEGYHPRIIAYLISHFIDDKESVHTQLAKMYFETEEIDAEMYKKSKELTFQQMYGGISKKYLKHEYFNKTQKFIDALWDEFNEKGYVKTLIARRRLLKGNYKNITPQKLFNYYIQAFETEYNITLLSRIFKFLEDKKSKMVLYVYDSMLFDFSLEDGKETLQSLKKLISSDFPIKLKKGNIYSSLEAL
tara:strand:+ start:1763 stop:3088 length:1326 start_codon:yes stop_codon:yes gene_type:complete